MGLTTNSIAMSGLNAAIRRTHVAGDNIARQPVTNAAKKRLEYQTGAQGGVETSVSEVKLPEAIKNLPNDVVNLSTNIDYAEEIVSQTTANHAFNFNKRVIDAEDQMQKTLLDIKV